jgi:pilus assembly protein Flp/PilA
MSDWFEAKRPLGIACYKGMPNAQRVGAGGRRKVRNLFSIRKDDRAATAVEYGLILALIFLAIVGAISGVATVTTDMWGNVSNQVAAAH